VVFARAGQAGNVKDSSGAVTVEAASPALLEKTRSVVTDGSGNYKIENVRPGSDVCRLLGAAGVRVVGTPERAPNANAHAERFVRSIKEECLNRIIPLGERHLRRAVAEFVAHYHRERNHQGLDNELIAGAPVTDAVGRVRRRPRLGGLLNYYERAA